MMNLFLGLRVRHIQRGACALDTPLPFSLLFADCFCAPRPIRFRKFQGTFANFGNKFCTSPYCFPSWVIRLEYRGRCPGPAGQPTGACPRGSPMKSPAVVQDIAKIGANTAENERIFFLPKICQK